MTIRCVCLQEEDKTDKDGNILNEKGEILNDKDKTQKPAKMYKCQAVVGTSPWEVDKTEMSVNKCMDKEFAQCLRLEKFIEYTRAANTLNVKSQ